MRQLLLLKKKQVFLMINILISHNYYLEFILKILNTINHNILSILFYQLLIVLMEFIHEPMFLPHFKKDIINLYFTVDSEDRGRVEASAKHNNFDFSLLYTGTRSFVLKISGYDNYLGFIYMETNKGMNIHDDLSSGNEHVSNEITSKFLRHYKSPYLVTETYKNFITHGKSFI